MTIWFTSDHHFGHKNIIRFSERPFVNVEEMNNRLIENWNAVVQPKDSVYHLGDVSFMRPEETIKLLSKLNGEIFLIKGNHDKNRLMKSANAKKRFGWIRDIYEFKVPDSDMVRGEQLIVLCHYPMLTWNKSHYGSWMLHGHCHGNLPDDPNALRIDVGVDNHNYIPVSYEDVKKMMLSKNIKK